MLPSYFLRIAPGVTVFAVLFAALPKKNVSLRIACLILVFLLFRDAMTPAGLWRLGRDGSLSFHDDPFALVVLGSLSLGLVVLVQRTEPGLAELMVWWRGDRGPGVVAGIAGACAIAAPVLLYTHHTLKDSYPAPMSGSSLLGFLYLALAGNLLEEALFRGWLQGLLERETSRPRAIAGSALAFAAGHAFLATTVTDLGIPLLAFTLYEGTVAAGLRSRWGVVSSTLAHGGAIFLLASHLL
jgi:membrane protease YdiL (CAAX protease family)